MEDFRDEGERVTRKLTAELRTVETRVDLVALVPKLRKEFNELVDVIIRAQEFISRHHLIETEELTPRNYALSAALFEELNRVYSIEGGRELIEKAQEEALHRLDAFEKGRESLRTIP